MPDEPSGASPARVEALYQELILDHYRRPRNRRPLADATGQASLRNPLCGDEVTMQVRLDGDVVADAAFAGQGCSISQAAASMLTSAVHGRTRAEAAALLRDYGLMLADRHRPAELLPPGDLRALSGVARFPARVRCGLMAAEALGRALGSGDGVGR